MNPFSSKLLLVLLLLGVPSAYSQVKPLEPCNISTAPEVRGLRLGMTLEEASRKFPNASSLKFQLQTESNSETGEELVKPLNLFDWRDREEEFKGVNQIALSLTDRKLAKLEYLYDNSTQWQSIREFTSQLSKSLSLPQAWRNPVNANARFYRVMDCKGFRVIASFEPGGRSLLSFVDTVAEALVTKRQKEIEAKNRRTFRP